MRCGRYFSTRSEREETPCRFHLGDFKSGINDMIGFAGMNTAWTCCKQHERDAVGCKSSSWHLQCMETLKTLQEMNRGGDGNLLDILDEVCALVLLL